MSKKRKIFSVVVLSLFALFLIYSFANSRAYDKAETEISDMDTNSIEKKEALAFSTQINEEGPVSVSIQPLMSSFAEQEELEFKVILDTHSVELSMDLVEAVVLVIGEEEQKAILWEGDPPEGHHREGVISFSGSNLEVKSFEILVRDIGGVPVRKYMWITQS